MCVLRQVRQPLWRRVLCGAVRAVIPVTSAGLILNHVSTREAVWGFAGYTLLFGRVLWMTVQACRARRAVRGIAAKYEERLAALDAELTAARAAA